MKILILANNYYPYKKANELCIYNIIKWYTNYEFSIISLGSKNEIIKQKNINIYSINIKNIKRKFINFFSSFIYELPYRIMSLFYKPIISKRIVKKYIELSKKIISKDKPDIIISVINPIESVEAGYLLKKEYSDIRFIIYDIDTLSNRSIGIIERIFKIYYLNIVRKYENKVFSLADLIIHLKWHKDHFSTDFYKKFNNKTLYQGIPLLDIKERTTINNNHEDFIYAGRFYRNLREPKVLIDIFELVLKKQNKKLHIYTDDLYVKKIKGSQKILIHNYIEQNELDKIIDSTSFLVSIGNSYTDMFPSKIVTYVGTLKPIIHIYQTPSDPVIEFLKNYPDALLIYSKDDTATNANKIIDFINSERPLIEAKYIRKIYKDNLSEYNANEILNFLKNEK